MLATSALPAQNSTITLTMDDNSLWNGASFIESNAAGTGTIALTMNDAVWNLRDSSTLTSLTLNAGGTINFQHAEDAAWQTLTIKDDFIGNGGKLVFNTVLFDDTSETDKLIVEGNTSGHTGVEVNNIGGAGAQTVEGIEIVSVGGNSEGTFEKASRIVAGGYDYNVVQKGKNWFLTSLVEPVDPVDPPVDPVDPPVDPVDPVDPPVDPVIPPQEPVPPAAPPKGEHQYRPEFGSYLANSYAANTLFMTHLHDRLGETQYTDMLTGEQKVTSLWMRNVGAHTRFNDGSGQLKTRINSYVLQLGGDLAQWSTDGLDRWHIGAPCPARLAARSVRVVALWALSALFFTVTEISSMLAAVSTIAAACSSVREARSRLPAEISLVPPCTEWLASLMLSTMRLSCVCMVCRA